MSGSQNLAIEDQERWARLTEKQRACLDLLVERQTSKQIARRLDISKDTVDQRITAARKTLGAADRDEAAIIYSRLRKLYDRVVYDPMEVPRPPRLVPSEFADGDPSSVIEVHTHQGALDGSSGSRPPFGTIWRHDYSRTARFMIMAAMLVAVVISLLGGLGIAYALTQLISG